MANKISHMLVVLGLALMAPSAQAQVNPTQQSVNEGALLEALGSAGNVAGRITIPDQNACYLIKPDNKIWAALQGDTLHQISIWAVIGMVVLLPCSM